MADDTVFVKITADPSGVAPGINTAKAGVEGLTETVAAASAQMRGSFATVSASVREMGVTIRETVGVVGEMKEMMIGFGEALIAAFAIEKIAEWSRQMGEAAEKTKHTGEIFGMTAPEVQGLQGAAISAGLGIDTLTRAMGILDKNMVVAATGSGPVALAFKAMGIAASDGKTQIETLLAIADKFHNMEDGPKKVALAMVLLGKSGKEMVPFLNLGREGILQIDAANQKYSAGVIVATAANVELRDWLDKVNAKGNELADTNNTQSVAMMGLSNVMTDAFAPMLTEIAAGVNRMILAFVESYKQGGTVAIVMEAITGTLQILGTAINAMWEIWVAAWDAVLEQIHQVVGASVDGFGKKMPSAMEYMTTFVNKVRDSFIVAKDVIVIAISAISGLIQMITGEIKMLGIAVYDALTLQWGKIQSDWQAGLDNLNRIVVEAAKKVKASADEMGKAIAAAMKGQLLGGESGGIPEPKQTKDFNPNLSKAPKAKKEKKPKDDLVQKLNTELEGEKAAFAMRQEAQGTYEAFALESEVKFWADSIGLTEAKSKDRAAVEAKWLAAVQALRKQDNAAALEAIKANAAQQLVAAKSDADQATIALQTKINDVDTAARVGLISGRQALAMKRDLNQQMLQADIDLAKAEETIRIAALENELRDEKLAKTQRDKIDDQIETERKTAVALIIKLNQKKDEQLIKDDNAVFANQALKIKEIAGSFSSSISQMITLQQSFSATMKSLWGTVASTISGALSSVLTKYIAQLITTMGVKMGLLKATSVAETGSASSIAGANGVASMAGAPFPLNTTAPEFGVAMSSAAKAFSIPQFASGTMSAPGGWSLVGEQGPELVNLPRGAGVLTNDQSRGQMGGTTHINIHTIDTQSMARWARDNGHHLAAGVKKAVRDGWRG